MAAKITIISTIYKAEKTLSRLLDSCMAQKSDDIEFFLIDNGSPDGCGEICDKYAMKDQRFTVHHLSENIGYIGARNWALERVEGEYIGFADSDDYIQTGAYDNLLKIINEYNPDYIVCSHIKVDKSGNKCEVALNYKSGIYTEEELNRLKKSYIGIDENICAIDGFMWRCLYKNKIIQQSKLRLNNYFIPMEDGVFNFEYVSKCNSIYIHNEPIYYFFVNDSSVTKTIDIDWCEQHYRIYKYKHSKLDNYENIKDSQDLLINELANLVVYSLYNVNDKLNLKEYIKYVRQNIEENNIDIIILKARYVNPKIKYLYKTLIKHKYVIFCCVCKYIKLIKTLRRQ